MRADTASGWRVFSAAPLIGLLGGFVVPVQRPQLEDGNSYDEHLNDKPFQFHSTISGCDAAMVYRGDRRKEA